MHYARSKMAIALNVYLNSCRLLFQWVGISNLMYTVKLPLFVKTPTVQLSQDFGIDFEGVNIGKTAGLHPKKLSDPGAQCIRA